MRAANGAERAALVLLALGETHGGPLWSQLTDEEAALMTRTIARLGSVDRQFVNAALDLFAGELEATSGISGSPHAVETLVSKVLPQERAAPLIERLRRPGGPDVWDRLAGLADQVLADHLAREHPQTVAVVLKRIAPQQSARVLARLPNEVALDCLARMSSLETVEPAALAAIEAMLGEHLVEPHSGPPAPDPTAGIADIFNLIDKDRAEDLLQSWRQADADLAERVRTKMFTFDDFATLPPATIQTLLRGLDKDLLALALKAASQDLRAFFMDQMSARAARMLDDQISSLGPVRLRDARAAQGKVVAYARGLEAAGELSLRPPGEETEEMVE